MKSRSQCFLLLGFIANSGRAAAQPARALERFDTSIESAAAPREVVRPQRAPIGFVGVASRDTRDVRTIAWYSASRKKITTSGIDEFPPGAIGAAIGAVVGGALGFLRVQAYCDNGVNCPAARSVLTGAAIGAIMGLFVEWVVRSGPQPG